MPRPTTAQIAGGALTVVLATAALLFATGARSGAAVAGLGAAGLLLGLLVAAAAGATRRPAAPVPAAAAVTPDEATAATVPRARFAGPARTRVTEHSLRR